MPGPAAAAACDAPVRAVVLSAAAVNGGRGGLVDGRGRRLRRPRDALHNVVVRPQFHLKVMIIDEVTGISPVITFQHGKGTIMDTLNRTNLPNARLK